MEEHDPRVEQQYISDFHEPTSISGEYEDRGEEAMTGEEVSGKLTGNQSVESYEQEAEDTSGRWRVELLTVV